jgi:hypothetical protein
MPRNVRNFWIETRVDGAEPRAMGPKASGGGFTQDILMREKGEPSATVIQLRGRVTATGETELQIVEYTPGPDGWPTVNEVYRRCLTR